LVSAQASSATTGGSSGIKLNRRSDNVDLVVMGGDGLRNGIPRFSENGRYLAWGNRDGTVQVADIVDLQRRLAKVGLG
jgi:hypothetical protein